MDAVEDSGARVEARIDGIEGRLERIEAAIGRLVANTEEIKTSIKTASNMPFGPSPEIFSGWMGEPLIEAQTDWISAAGTEKFNGAWVFYPSGK